MVYQHTGAMYALLLLVVLVPCTFCASSPSKSKENQTPVRKHQFGHLECSVAVDDFNSATIDTSKLCKEAEYFVKIKSLLNSTPDTRENDWLTNVLNSIVTVYDDLKFARSPTIVHIGGHHLNSTKKAVIHPISACIPEERVLIERQNKSRPIGLYTYHQHLTHGRVSSLLLDHDEDIGKSYFVLAQLQTVGWDSPYNVQILARGSLPLHLNLRHCPHSAMTAHPKKVFQNILKMPGLSLSANKPNATQNSHHTLIRCDPSKIPTAVYDLVVQAMLRYTHNVLTTSAMAAYLLETVLDEDIHSGTPLKNITSFNGGSSGTTGTGSSTASKRRLSWFGGGGGNAKKSKDKKNDRIVPPVSSTSSAGGVVAFPVTTNADSVLSKLSVLYLTHHPHDAFQDDFLTDLLLHGLIRVLGASSVTDYPRRNNLYLDSVLTAKANISTTSNTTSGGIGIKAKHDWDLKILSAQDPSRQFSSAAVKAAIESHKYDMVIIASDHHRDEFDKQHPTHGGQEVPQEVSTVEFYNEVCRHYKPSEVVYVDGSEHHLTRKLLDRYANCVGHFFSREGFVESS